MMLPLTRCIHAVNVLQRQVMPPARRGSKPLLCDQHGARSTSRHVFCRSSSLGAQDQQAGAEGADDSADVEAALRNSVDMISQMIEDICARMAVECAAAFVYDEELEATTEQAIRDQVTKNLDKLDQMALQVMQLMAQASKKNGDERMAEMIMQMRAETLRQIKRILPTEVQVLDSLVRLSDQAERRALVKGVSVAELGAIASTASQMVTDIEELDAIPDVPMLARLVIVREELFATMEELEPGSTRKRRYTSVGVPRVVAGFINNLAALDDPVQRQMQLFSALTQACKAPSKHQLSDPEAVVDRLRPGLVMTTLYILRTDLEENLVEEQSKRELLQSKFRDLVMDAMVVIDDISKRKHKLD